MDRSLIALLCAIKELGKRVSDPPPKRKRWPTAAGWSAIAAMASCVSALISLVALYFSQQDAVEQSREIHAEQRPVIWVGTNQVGAPRFVINPLTGAGQIVWTFHFSNFGKSIVARGTGKMFLKVGDKDFERSFEQDKSGIVIVPIVPSEDVFTSVISRPGITNAQFEALLLRDKAIQLKAVFDYADPSGSQYESVVCLAHLRTGAILYCDGGYIR
jgi:hypothetical protein